MVLISLTTTTGGAGVLLLTENFINKNRGVTAHLVINSLQMLCVVLLPAMSRAITLTQPVHTLFYGTSSSTTLWLSVGILVQVIFLALYSPLASTLRALFENRKAI